MRNTYERQDTMEVETRNGMTFDQWYKRCDQICGGIAGLGIDDLADGPSWDRWEDGCPPREYVLERLEDEGFPS
jgi:hypothetical protein